MVYDKTYQINVLNSHRLRDRPEWSDSEEDGKEESSMLKESIENYKELRSYKEVVESEGLADVKANKYQSIRDLLYYASSKGKSSRMELYVLKGPQSQMLEQCYEKMRHIGIDKTIELIS